jgi:hypothetical protein
MHDMNRRGFASKAFNLILTGLQPGVNVIIVA